MPNVNSAEVHFHQQEQLSVYLESNVNEEQEKIGEIGLFPFFSLRMLANFGVNDTSDSLATLLVNAPEAVPLFASGRTTGGFDLIAYPGHGRNDLASGIR